MFRQRQLCQVDYDKDEDVDSGDNNDDDDGLDFSQQKVHLSSIMIYDTIQCHIIFIAKLAFGKSVPVETIPTTGISKVHRNLTTTYRNLTTKCRKLTIYSFFFQVTAVDFEYAKILKSTIKLIGEQRTRRVVRVLHYESEEDDDDRQIDSDMRINTERG